MSAAKRWWIVSVLCAWAVVVRCVPLLGLRASVDERVRGAPELLLDDPETCLHLRFIEVAVAQRELARVDRALFHPLGDVPRDPPALDGLIAAGLQVAGWRPAFGDGGAASAAERVATWWGPVCGAALVSACFLLVWIAFAAQPRRDAAAIGAAWIAACAGIDACSGILNSATTSAIPAAFAAVVLIWGARAAAPFDRVLGAVMSGALSGSALLCSLDAALPLALAQLALLIACARATGERARDLHRAALLCLLAFALVIAVPARSSVWNALQPGTLRAFGQGWLALVLGLAAGHGACVFAFRRGIEERGWIRALLPVVGMIALPLCSAETRAVWSSLRPDAAPSGAISIGAWIPVLAAAVGAACALAPRRLARIELCAATIALLVLQAQGWRHSFGDARADTVELLSSLRTLRNSTVERGAWPAAGSTHPSGVFAPAAAPLVPFHARRSALPGVYPSSALDTELHTQWRDEIAFAASSSDPEHRDQRLAALGASHALERASDGRWRARELPLPEHSRGPVLRALDADRARDAAR